MKRIIKIDILATVVLGFAMTAAAREISLSVYNNDFALVKDQRGLEFKAGVNEFRFTDVAATIEPSSVRFRSLDDSSARIVEQNFQFDLVGSAKLMEKYIDQPVEVLTVKGELISGKLLRAQEKDLILQREDGLRILSNQQIAGIKLAKLPEGLLTRPTLVWQMYTAKGGKQLVQLDYLARSIKWEMNYNATLSPDEKRIDLDGWVTLTNNSGTSFPQARISLIAGETGREEQPRWQDTTSGVDVLRTLSKLSPSTQRGKELSEQFGEYHLYRLGDRTDVSSGQIKQVKLISAKAIASEKIYLYDGSKVPIILARQNIDPNFGREGNKKVNVVLAIENRADRNLGVALPPGLARIFKRDQDKSLEFIGEDKIPATAVDERVLMYIGDAFDLVGERTQTEFRRTSQRTIEEAFKIELKNHKKEPVTIMVIERLYRWSNWEILSSSDKYDKINSRTIRYMISLKPDEAKTVEYRVRYSW